MDLPEEQVVKKALDENPGCSLSMNETVSFTQSSGGLGEETREKKFYLSCPSKPTRLLHRITTKRQVAPGEVEFNGGEFSGALGGRLGIEAVLKDMLGGRPFQGGDFPSTTFPFPQPKAYGRPPPSHPPLPAPGSVTV